MGKFIIALTLFASTIAPAAAGWAAPGLPPPRDDAVTCVTYWSGNVLVTTCY